MKRAADDGRELEPKQCSSCRASILWCLTERGRPMPVDVQPQPKGTLMLYRDWVPDFGGLGGELVGPYRVRAVDAAVRSTRACWWVSHFATCPAAERHRVAR